MSVRWRRTIFAVAGAVSLLGVVMTASQVGSAQTPAANQGQQMAEEVFKNVQVLKGIPVDEFMETMGMFASATAKDCTGCHSGDIMARREAFADVTPEIQIARAMVRMLNEINGKNFGGEKKVTCYTCHAGSAYPNRVPNLSVQYGTPPAENPNSQEFIAIEGESADPIFNKYIQAIGGAERLAKITSFAGTGTYAGWDTAFTPVPLELYARAPNQLTTIVRREKGNNIRVFDGKNGWFAGVDSPLPTITMNLTGGNLFGANIEAMVLSAPQAIRKTLSQWQVSETTIDLVETPMLKGAGALPKGLPVKVVQGTTAGQDPVNLYFDDSGMLVRLVRWTNTSVGAVPTQIDFADYRDVAGVKIPFQWIKTWTNNQVVMQFKDMRPNVAVDAARFARPAPIAPQR